MEHNAAKISWRRSSTGHREPVGSGLYDAPVTFRAVWLGGLVVALLAGCSQDDPPASTLPPLSVAPSPSAPSAEPVPSAAQAATPQGAGEFARYFYEQVEQAFVDRDPERVRRLSAPGCRTCADFIESLTRLRDNGERVDGAVYDILAAEAPSSNGETTTVTVIYNGPPVVRYAADGTIIAEEPEVRFMEEELVLVRAAGAWLVMAVNRP